MRFAACKLLWLTQIARGPRRPRWETGAERNAQSANRKGPRGPRWETAAARKAQSAERKGSRGPRWETAAKRRAQSAERMKLKKWEEKSGKQIGIWRACALRSALCALRPSRTALSPEGPGGRRTHGADLKPQTARGPKGPGGRLSQAAWRRPQAAMHTDHS